MIFLTTTPKTLASVLDQIREEAGWIQGAELRVDLLAPAEQQKAQSLKDELAQAGFGPLPLIATVRRTADGGRSELEDAARLETLLACARAGFDYVDIEREVISAQEHSDLIGSIRETGVRVISSAHDFHGVPDRLERPLALAPDILKLAATPTSTADLVRLVRYADELTRARVPHIVLGMGEFGFPTRILTHRMGNLLTFASAPGAIAAPGHVTPELLATLYRLPAIGPRTRYFAVIGNPIGHSKSPDYHNARFSEDRIDACYLPILVDQTDAMLELAELVPVLGFSITIPHKQAIIPALADAGADVHAAGACNTVVRIPDGWRGINTDVLGFLAPLEELLGAGDASRETDEVLSGRNVLVLGAGGAARGVVYALLSRGANVLLCNRTPERAAALALDLERYPAAGTLEVISRTDASSLEVVENQPVAVVVNTTSVGMHGEGDPAPWYQFSGNEIAYDIVYTPPDTPFIQRAVGAGCRVVTGDRMFAAQAAAQYELYRVLATATPDVS